MENSSVCFVLPPFVPLCQQGFRLAERTDDLLIVKELRVLLWT